jgi:hypothetical protein
VKSFREFALTEKRGFPIWIRGAVILIAARIKSLSSRIEKEPDPKKQNDMIASQNRLIGYITSLGIAIDTKNRKMISKLKGSSPK